jgi:maltose alpha-D-glucosyltransferase/alpha-amylase
MYSLLFTLPGAPVLYYGDEIGMGDNVELFDRNGVRTPMQWTPGENAGFSAAPPASLYAPVIDDPAFSYRTVNVLNQQAARDSLLHTVRRMIRTRKQVPVLARGTLEWLHELPPEALCFWRRSAGQMLLALHNLSGEPFDLYLPPGHHYTDAFSADKQSVEHCVTLAAYGYRWLLAE